MVQTQYCARHPKKETNIRCGRCETPICPDCLVHAPVGMRCPDCARVNRVPTYDVPLPYLLRGIGAGAAVGIALGIAFLFGSRLLFNLALQLGVGVGFIILPWLYSAVTVAIGYAIGEAVSLATNRKRGNRLKIVSALSMVLASGPIFIAYPAAFGMLPLIIGLALGTWMSLRRF